MDTKALSPVGEIVATLNALLRGELAAVETYDQAIGRLAGATGDSELARIRGEHFDAVQALRAYVIELGGTPDNTAGPWGAFAKAVEGAATLLGNRAAVRTLIAGEEAGAAAYENALLNDIPSVCFALIHSRLLPHTRDHITILDTRLFQSAGNNRRGDGT